MRSISFLLDQRASTWVARSADSLLAWDLAGNTFKLANQRFVRVQPFHDMVHVTLTCTRHYKIWFKLD